MQGIFDVLKALLAAMPVINRLLGLFIKTESEKAKESIEDARAEIDEFKKTGRPPK